jgi:alkanesulfonate monooxygenase SsuD/methylene tetrahydromethanopterin reductase-like flavin-dependent oxidoreductase (luciferase family)
VKFGVLLTPIYDAAVPPRQHVAEHREVVALADELGFDVIVAGQHFLGSDLRFYQPVPYLSNLVAAYDRLEVLTGIVLLSLVNAVDIAEQVATLDAVTDGRAIFGIGLGYSDHEFGAFGARRSERVARFEEALALIRQLWSGDEVNFHGRFYTIDGARPSVLPVRSGGVPIWIGAQASASVRRAARLGDAWYAAPFPTHEELRALRVEYLEERCANNLATNGEFPVRRDLVIDETRSAARERAIAWSTARYATYRKWGLDGAVDHTGSVATQLDGDVADRWILGDEASCAEHLARLRDQLGMTQFYLKAHWPGVPHAESMQQLERFGTGVIPLLR